MIFRTFPDEFVRKVNFLMTVNVFLDFSVTQNIYSKFRIEEDGQEFGIFKSAFWKCCAKFFSTKNFLYRQVSFDFFPCIDQVRSTKSKLNLIPTNRFNHDVFVLESFSPKGNQVVQFLKVTFTKSRILFNYTIVNRYSKNLTSHYDLIDF